jgi:hypothetical protein
LEDIILGKRKKQERWPKGGRQNTEQGMAVTIVDRRRAENW